MLWIFLCYDSKMIDKIIDSVKDSEILSGEKKRHSSDK